MSDYDKLASAMPSDQELFGKLIQLIKVEEQNQFINPKYMRININQGKLKLLKPKENYNYHVFFLGLLLLYKEDESFFSTKINYNNQEKYDISEIEKHQYMLTIFDQLNKYQQKEILLISDFILNHQKDDLWTQYEKLIENVKTFLSRL